MLMIKTSQKPVGDVTVETSIFYIQSVVFLQKRLKTNIVCSVFAHFSTLAQTFCNCCCLSSITQNFYTYLIFFLFSSLQLEWKIITGRSQQEEERSFRRFIQRPFLCPVSPVRTGSYYLCWRYLLLTEEDKSRFIHTSCSQTYSDSCRGTLEESRNENVELGMRRADQV